MFKGVKGRCVFLLSKEQSNLNSSLEGWQTQTYCKVYVRQQETGKYAIKKLWFAYIILKSGIVCPLKKLFF